MISIIIPVYNASKYIERCLYSVLSQSYSDIEIIVVDDGSCDDSYKKILEFASRDSRIVAITQSNGGSSKARLTGFLASKGDCITFVDSDDSLMPDALKNLHSKMNLTTDIVLGEIKGFQYKKDYYEIEDFRRLLIRGDIIHTGPVAKLFRKRIISSEVFCIPKEIKRGEDMLMNIRIAFNTNLTVAVVHKIVYNYIPNPNSIIHTFKVSLDNELLFDQIRKESIPKQLYTKYAPVTLYARKRALIEYIIQHPRKEEWAKHQFCVDLMTDVKKYSFKLQLLERLSISTHSNAFRIIILFIYRKMKRCKYLLSKVFPIL